MLRRHDIFLFHLQLRLHKEQRNFQEKDQRRPLKPSERRIFVNHTSDIGAPTAGTAGCEIAVPYR